MIDRMDLDERIDMLEGARENLTEAIRLIQGALLGTPAEDYADTYLIPTLQMAAGESHAYLGRQRANLDELIRILEADE